MTSTHIIAGIAVLILLIVLIKKKSNSSGSSFYKNITAAELDLIINDKNTVLIDVRTKNEINQGNIADAMEIELGTSMNQAFSKLDKNKNYILYCRSGRRSAIASKMMSKMGFNNVSNLKGGYIAWSQK